MKRFKPLSRRTILRGLLGGTAVSVGLPPLEAMFNATGTAYALDGILPKRFGLFFWGNGNRPERWTPTGEGFGADWTLSEELAPLASIKHKLAVVSGMAINLPNESPHGTGAAGILSAAPLADPDDGGSFTAPSIDQVIATAIGGDTLYRSLETAATNNSGRSYNGPNSVNPPEGSPIAFFERIFGETFREPGDTEVSPTLGLRRSVLDAVMGDVDKLETRVGAADKLRLEQHLDGVRDLEVRLAKLQEDPPDLAACLKPDPPQADYPDIAGRPQISEVSRAMCDLLTMALACDQTRVFSHWFTDPVSDVLFPNASAGHHDLTHNEHGDQQEVHAITVQCIAEYAYLLQALDAVPEGTGTLLDNCAVLGASEVSLGQTHSITDMPILIGGSACGTFHQDFHYRSLGGESASMVLLSLIRSMGIIRADLGVEGAYTNVGLSALEI